jgi:hypothetical protein
MYAISRLMRAAAGISLATAVAACGSAGYSQTVTNSPQSGNLALPTFGFHGQLDSVAAASAGNAWAVGFSGTLQHPGTLMLHWDGQGWNRVTNPAVLDGAPGTLEGVIAASPVDAWAVGFTGTISSEPGEKIKPTRALLLHWDGTRWSQAADLPADATGLSGIAMSGHGGWAVGTSFVDGHVQPLILRRDGTKWHRVPAPAGAVGLTKVAVTPTGTAWAIGVAPDRGSQSATRGVLVRWNGRSWQGASFPISGPANWVSDITAGPDGAAWAVGQDATAAPPLSMRWTGAAWRALPVPGPNGGFYGVTVAPGGAVWAVGVVGADLLTMRWTRSSWARVPAPVGDNPQAVGALTSVTFSAPTYGWAVGTYSMPGQGSQQQMWPLIVHWNGITWN